MPTAMQLAFVKSESVTTKTDLGKRILGIAVHQNQREREHIRFVAQQKAEARIAREAKKEEAENAAHVDS